MLSRLRLWQESGIMKVLQKITGYIYQYFFRTWRHELILEYINGLIV